MRRAPDRPTGRRAAAAVVAVLGVGGLGGCGQDEAAPGGVTAEQLQDVRDDVATLSERVDELEAARSSAPATAGETSAPATTTSTTTAPAPTFTAGEDVSLGGEVTRLISTTAVGSAFRLATGEGATVTVISPTPVADLDAGDVVRVSGVATLVQDSSFERDFGIAADVLLDDPDAFLTDQAGQLAVAADRVQPEEENAD